MQPVECKSLSTSIRDGSIQFIDSGNASNADVPELLELARSLPMARRRHLRGSSSNIILKTLQQGKKPRVKEFYYQFEL